MKYNIWLFLWAIALLFISFGVNRADFPLVIGVYAIAFVAYFCLCYDKDLEENSIQKLILFSILIRGIVVFAFPFFSDDIYRFWWDGKLLSQGINPFAEIPRYYIDNQQFTDDFSKSVFLKLNSPDYYSVYPPVCQAIFTLSYWLSPKSIYGAALVIKGFIFLCEIGTIFLLSKLLSPKKTLLYALNPLVIIELCGNAHFEGAMLFFFVACLYCILDKEIITIKRLLVAAFLLALSVAAKLLTLVFLPLILKKLGFQKGFVFSIAVGIFILALFFPFVNTTFIAHFSESLNLYFQKFEFNASLYYILRAIGKFYYGYAPTIQISYLLKICTLATVAYFFFKKGNFFQQAFLFFTCYLFFQSTVHPWYLSTLVLLSVFVPFRYGILWSGAIMLSYIHYWGNQYQENYWFIALEYSLVIAFLLYEMRSFSRN
jgi:alpha-1,6-mannosyltransferase